MESQEDTAAQQKEQQLEMLKKKREEWAKSALAEMREELEKGHTREEEAGRKKEEALRQAMDVPPEGWKEAKESLKEEIEKRHQQGALAEGSAARNENLSDDDILRWASGGLALQGIFQTCNLGDCVQKREQLIQIPEGFQLLGPSQGPQSERRDFSSSEAESKFRKTVEQLGLSFGLAFKYGIGEEYIESSSSYRHSSESKESSKSCSEHSYICTTQYNYVPIASCHFPKDQLRLSHPALQDLRKMEQLLRHVSDKDKEKILKNRCEGFFNTFGSHVNQGPLHLGGIFWQRVSSEGFKADKRQEIKMQISRILSFNTGCSSAGSVASEEDPKDPKPKTEPNGANVLGGAVCGVKGSWTSSSASSKDANRQAAQMAAELFVSKTGGPPEADLLTPWKSGLLASNKTWSVIDRGDKFIPVWEIVLANHKKDFKDVLAIANSLRDCYAALTGKKVEVLHGEELIVAEEEARAFLENIKAWKITGEQEKLEELVRFKEKLYATTKSDRMWINLCLSNQALQDFLEQSVLLYKRSLPKNTGNVRFLLRRLLEPHIYSVPNFPSSSEIMRWVFAPEQKQQDTDVWVPTLADLTGILQQMKKSIEEAEEEPGQAAEEAMAKVSTELSFRFCSLLKALKEGSQEETALLLLSIAHSVGYNVENDFFQYRLGSSQIDFILQKLKEAYEKHQALVNLHAPRAQAYVVLMGLATSADGKEVPPEEKGRRLTFMKEHMQESWGDEVANVLRRHNIQNDWNLLEEDLAYLVDGNYEATNYEQQKECVVRELEGIFQASNPSGNTECKDLDFSHDPRCSNITNHEFLDLIKMLDLEKYYPNKMQMTDFHLIHKISSYDQQPSAERELPLYFLEKLLMLDYRARYLSCKDNISTVQDNTSDFVEASDKCLDDLDYIFDDATPDACHEDVQSSRKHIHPMDVQMAIFLCADDFTRQYMATKLSVCQFALPLLVPNPCTSQIEFPLWSLCQVNKKWQCTQEFQKKRIRKCKDELIYQARTPLVSFIRFSTSPVSKSQLLNHLLSKQKHDVFFHRHCKGSSKNCLLMKGVAEIAWYCPSGKNDDSFDSCVAFTNLHGNAVEHKEQVEFLQEIASVTVILLSDNDRTGDSGTFLKELLKSPQPFIFLCVDKEQILMNKHEKRIKIAAKNRNEAELIEQLIQEIKSTLRLSNNFYSLEQCAPIAQKHGFLVDEDKEECKIGKATAESVVSILKKENMLEAKKRLLPLQGPLWLQWCEKDREQTHLQDHKNMGLEQQISQINSQKQIIRQKQLNQASPLNDLMKSLLTGLFSPSRNIKMYFLQWMKVLLADLTSDHLAELQVIYHNLWTQKQVGEDGYSPRKLEEVASEISESTFGLEHLLREIGQLYEALDVTSPPDKQAVQLLPQIAADMMELGYPIELMDGDASHVPLKWVSAVLDKLAEKLGDKEVFVLSVLGIQSSGKSTLLNAMFGLQLRASPGRCTRGAFMQLVKISDKLRPVLELDFLLIVDTEGLRAAKETDRSMFNRDNELATFVIGLGNMTVINIFGENPSEMQDVLQIVVQAFLRMKQVNLSPSCLFVHQNVGEIAREEKNRETRRCIQQNLDEMAVTAAQQESCEVSSFSDVIHFDVNSHVHYFSHLWEGEPPMAPPNPSYSQNIQELKCKILTDAKEKSAQEGLLKMSELKLHIQSLWEALLNETFVFSFKNTLEIAAYSRLENKYSKWSWELRSFVLDQERRLMIQIQNDKLHSVDRASLTESIKNKYAEIMVDFDKYFCEDKYRKQTIQWKGNTKIKLDFLMEELANTTCRNCERSINLKSRWRSFEQKRSTFQDEILQRSKELAKQFMHKELSEHELREKFNSMWAGWMSAVSPPASHASHVSIQVDVEHFLCERFKSEPGISERIKTSAKLTRFPCESPQYISAETWVTKKWREFTRCLPDKLSQRIPEMKRKAKKPELALITVRSLTDSLERLVNNYVQTKEKESMNYSSSYFHEIVQIINEEMSTFADPDLTLPTSYRVDIALYLCQKAAKRFTEMHQKLQKENDPSFFLESKREDFFQSFAISCQGAKSVTTFAVFLCNSLRLAIRDAIHEKAAIHIADIMKAEDPAFSNRKMLEKYMLIHLAEQEHFEKYMEYIYHPNYYMGEFIRRRVDQYCLDKKQPRLKDVLNTHLSAFQKLLSQAINDSTRIAEDKGGNASLWLDEFCLAVGDDLVLPRHTLASIEHQEVANIRAIEEAINDSLAAVLDHLKQEFMTTDFEPFIAKPHEILLEQFSGCLKQCPFCKAVCTNTIPGHDGAHRTPFHRPQALTGIQWEGTNHLVIETCSTIVSGNYSLLFEEEKIPCSEFQMAGSDYAKWDIRQDIYHLLGNSAQNYWKWFICHFRSELEKAQKGVFKGKGAIPWQWESLQKEDILSRMKANSQDDPDFRRRVFFPLLLSKRIFKGK
ncbi:interferon-induced very large GTPase 1-like [Sceloporus undulatus]|uniref:interferon-induced very large GTPase 1-like n=1 Tax=Sceloporus undulatus TaxID=8520 RepID=UPI001C4AC7D6|nr:interferon-induced very large GTPase 1-like [Sceloporus undulatus]